MARVPITRPAGKPEAGAGHPPGKRVQDL